MSWEGLMVLKLEDSISTEGSNGGSSRAVHISMGIALGFAQHS